MAVRVVDRDNGYAALMRAIDQAGRGFEVTVGIHEEEGGGASASGRTVAEVAEINEFGLGPPARPFVSAWADERRSDVLNEIRDRAARALRAGQSMAGSADQLAQKYAGEVQAKIAGGVPPPNAPSTIARKGSSTPLVNTGQLRAAVRGKVRGK